MAQVGRKGVPLEGRRAQGQIAIGQSCQGHKILASHRLQIPIGGDAPIGIESITQQDRLGVELRVGPQPGTGPDVSQVESFSPATVGNHHIGLQPLLAQQGGQGRHLGAAAQVHL